MSYFVRTVLCYNTNKEVINVNKEDQMIEMLGKIMNKLDEHSGILNEHSKILKEHSAILNDHSDTLEKHGQILENHSSQLEEHKQILTALRSGQEYLKAELDGFKITAAKEFEGLKSDVNTIAINQEILRNDNWTNKVDIQRIKKTMGMA